MSKGRYFGYIAFGIFTLHRVTADSHAVWRPYLIYAMVFFIVLAVINAIRGDF